MNFLRAATALAVSWGLALSPTLAFAAWRDRVMNKEGYWGIDVDGDACAASMELTDGSIFTLRGLQGQVTFSVFFPKPTRQGKKGQVQTEAYSFDFEPSFTDDSRAVYYNGDLDNRAIAALRLAKEVRVLIDGRLVSAATFENTGFDGALDALIACSKGEKGWWGEGVKLAKAPGAPPADTGSTPTLNPEGYWVMAPTEDGRYCVAAAAVEGDQRFMFMGINGEVGFGAAVGPEFRRGRKGVFATDAYRFDFKPRYEGSDLFYGDQFLDSQALFALRRAASVEISIGGREAIGMEVKDTGLSGVLDAIIACSKGEKGWWGEGAKPRP